MDFENQDLPYPKSVFFILSNEFCERFSFYGMKTILALYLTSTLHYSQNDATVVFHLFTMLCYFFPLIGAIIADSFWGKFKTILYLSIIYALGSVVLSFAAIAIPTVPFTEISLLGLLMISIGTGGIKPCVSSFGGDQFVLPQQALQLQRFFSVFYFCINAGSLISTFLTPILRNNVKCFDQDTCFPLAFSVPAALMIISIVIFLSGKSLYIIRKPTENVITMFVSCILRALRIKFFTQTSNIKKGHWLEYANDKYSEQQISDIRAVLAVLYLFIPVPLFWALFDQQGSRWTFQATNLDGRFFGYDIKPDQMQVVNPLLILAFIPIFELYVYPALAVIGIRRPLQKLTLGGLLAAFAFVLTALLEFNVEKSYAILPAAGEGQIRIYNNLNCQLVFDPPIENINHLEPFSAATLLNVPVKGVEVFKTKLSGSESCSTFKTTVAQFNIYEKEIKTYFITNSEQSENEFAVYTPNNFDVNEKNEDGAAKIRFFYNSADSKKTVSLSLTNEDQTNKYSLHPNESSAYCLFHSGKYKITLDDYLILDDVEIKPGEIDTLLLFKDKSITFGKIINEVPSNTIHMFWQLPQIIVLTAAEIMFSITGLEFSFTQAPSSMKSVLSATWLLTVAFGNLIVAIISEINVFKSQAYQFLFYAGLMVLDMLLFILMSIKYQYVQASS